MEFTVDLNQTVSDETLIRDAAREGSDGPAFVELLARHRERVWRLCFRLMGNEHDAHDAAQEVFVRLFCNRQKFEGRSKFTTWLHGIAVKTCLGLRRSRGRRQTHEMALPESALPESAGSHSTADAGRTLDLYQVLDTLDEEDRALMILKYAESYTFEELASLMEMTPSACKMRISRARDRLRERFPEM